MYIKLNHMVSAKIFLNIKSLIANIELYEKYWKFEEGLMLEELTVC